MAQLCDTDNRATNFVHFRGRSLELGQLCSFRGTDSLVIIMNISTRIKLNNLLLHNLCNLRAGTIDLLFEGVLTTFTLVPLFRDGKYVLICLWFFILLTITVEWECVTTVHLYTKPYNGSSTQHTQDFIMPVLLYTHTQKNEIHYYCTLTHKAA